MRIKNAKVFQEDGTFSPGDVWIENDRLSARAAQDTVIDAEGCYAIPGLIDIHQHGCVQHDYSDACASDMEKMLAYQAAQGITTVCPTTMTLPEDKLTEACRQVSLCNGDGAFVAGIHMEGPFLSPQKAGAQNPAYLCPPDAALLARIQRASGGLVKMMSIAPECPGATALIAAIHRDFVCSIAHTAADYDMTMKAFAAGARHVTHLYNAMPPFSHRAPGVIGAAFDTPDCHVELICDGVHIHPAAVRATLRLFGEDRVVFVSDSMRATGLSDGAYELGGLPVDVRGRVATLSEGGAIAGSVTHLMDCVRTAVREMQVPLGTAVKCASVNAAKAVGVYDVCGSLTPGKRADVVLLGEDLSLRAVILRGVRI